MELGIPTQFTFGYHENYLRYGRVSLLYNGYIWSYEGEYLNTNISTEITQAEQPPLTLTVEFYLQCGLQASGTFEDFGLWYYSYTYHYIAQNITTGTATLATNDATIDNDGDGYSAIDGDCDDLDNTIYPTAVETCNGVDNDCDGDPTDGTPLAWYADIDGDGYGDPNTMIVTCTPPSTCLNSGDCNDGRSFAWSGAIDACGDGVDNNCSGDELDCIVQDFYLDPNGVSVHCETASVGDQAP